MNARIHMKGNSGAKPAFIIVIANDMVKDIPKDMNSPIRTGEYFLLSFIKTTLTPVLR